MGKKHNLLIAYKSINNLTWKEFAKKLKISRITLWRIAHGQSKDIKVSTANSIRRVTGFEPKDYITK